MRPRFSIRLLLVVITASATLCYVLFVRPTVLAQRFVDAVNERDYQTARSLLRSDFYSFRDFFAFYIPGKRSDRSAALIYAEVLPREWGDLWSFQRRFIFRVGLQDDSDGRHIEWTEDTEMVAFIDGVDVHWDDEVSRP
jgi:hypothetical protein